MNADLDKRPALSEVATEGRADVLGSLSQWPHKLYRVGALDDYGDPVRELAPVGQAQVISSEVDGRPDTHTLVLDLDVPARLVPSSTPGHSHLYVDACMTTERLVALLRELAAAGVIEEGFAAASIERGHTAVRLPWIKKGGNE